MSNYGIRPTKSDLLTECLIPDEDLHLYTSSCSINFPVRGCTKMDKFIGFQHRFLETETKSGPRFLVNLQGGSYYVYEPSDGKVHRILFFDVTTEEQVNGFITTITEYVPIEKQMLFRTDNDSPIVLKLETTFVMGGCIHLSSKLLFKD